MKHWKRWIQLKPHPFRVLLYLEWVLLAISLINHLFFDEAFDNPSQTAIFSISQLPWLFWISAIAFGIMGLRLPTKSFIGKILYTGIEFGAIAIALYFSWWDDNYLAPMLLIVSIRSCLLFQKVGQLVIAGAIFIFFTTSVGVFWLDWSLLDNETAISIYGESLTVPVPGENPGDLKSSTREIGKQRQSIDLELLELELLNIFLFGLILVFVLLLINALVAERNNRRKLAHAHAQLYQYAIRAEDRATLQERNRIAREIHDSLGHLLTAQSIQLENGLMLLKSNPKKAQASFQDSRQINSNALEELRQSVGILRADPLQGKTLEMAIATLIENFKQIAGMAIDYQIDLQMPVSTDIRIAVLQIIKEALTNIYKHSNATQAKIGLQTGLSSSAAPILCLQIEDDGRGFVVDRNSTGFGLKCMHERAVASGGRLKIVSKPEEGCHISGSFPLRRVSQ